MGLLTIRRASDHSCNPSRLQAARGHCLRALEWCFVISDGSAPDSEAVREFAVWSASFRSG